MSAKKKVLVIDGDRDACELISGVLGPRGFEVFSFSNPDEGVAKAGEIRPDLVFISILFPGSNGLKISKAVHSVEGLQGVPVIMLISYPDELDPRYTSTIGIVGVVLKPLDAREILSKTESVLGKGPEPEGPGEINAGIPAIEAETASLDEEWMSFLEKGDRETAEAGESVVEGEPEHASFGSVIEEGEAGGGREDERAAGRTRAGDAAEDSGWQEHDYGDAVTPDDTADFLSAEEKGKSVPEDEEESPGFSATLQRRSMKKFLVIASSVAVIAAGAGVGTYLFFQGHGRKIAAPVAKAPLKKAPAAGAKKDAVPPEKPAATTQALPAEKTAAAGPPSPKKVAKSKPETAPEGAKKESYSVQVGAFHNEGNAAALAGKLKKKGYDAFVLNDAGRQVHRVLIGKFGSSGAAAAEAKRLLEREDLKSIIYRH